MMLVLTKTPAGMEDNQGAVVDLEAIKDELRAQSKLYQVRCGALDHAKAGKKKEPDGFDTIEKSVRDDLEASEPRVTEFESIWRMEMER